MSRTALVLAAHGSHSDREVNRMVRAYAERITALGLFDEVSPAFHQGNPAFSAVLDRLNATRVVVVPLMTSAGYYSEIVLPRELRRNDRFRAVDVNQTEPVGTHRDVPSLLWDRVADRCGQHGFAPGDTTVIVVGHGTKRYARSRETTLCLVDRLAAEHPTCEFLGAFLEDDPSVESALTRATRRRVVVEPFLIADGPHTALDIPARLGLDASPTEATPAVGNVDGRTVVCNTAFGADGRVIDLILDLAGCADGDGEAPGHAAGLSANHRKDAACVR